MKVIFLNKILPYTGVTTHQLSLIEKLQKLGVEIKIITGFISEDMKRHFNSMNVQVVIVPFPLGSGLNDSKIIQLFWYILSLPICIYHLLNFKPQLIHVHWPVTSFIAYFYRKLTKTPFIQTFHISGIKKSLLYKKGDFAIAISEELKNEIISDFYYKDSQVEKIYNGIDIEKFSNKVDLMDPNYFTFSYIGTLNYRKGIDTLIEAFSAAEIPNKRLLLQGVGDLDLLNSLIKKYEISESQFELIDYGDPISTLSRSNCFILASRVEGFGLVSIEAMAARVPVIRSKTEGTSEQIIDNVTGVSFEVGDVNHLKRLMEEMSRDSKFREKIKLNAYNRVTELFSSETMADKTLKLYRKVINS